MNLSIYKDELKLIHLIASYESYQASIILIQNFKYLAIERNAISFSYYLAKIQMSYFLSFKESLILLKLPPIKDIILACSGQEIWKEYEAGHIEEREVYCWLGFWMNSAIGKETLS